jgi:hypothetical protein
MNRSGKDNGFFRPAEAKTTSRNWLFEIEPYSRTQGESLSELRDNLRLKKALRRAVNRDLAPMSLIRSIRTDIRA